MAKFINTKNVLLTGNTGYINENFIKAAFPNDRVLVMDQSQKEEVPNKKWTPFRFKKAYEELNVQDETFEFDKMVYFSEYLTFHGKREDELETVRRILKKHENDPNLQIVYLTGLEGSFLPSTEETVRAESIENLCLHYSMSHNMQIKVIRIPYLYSAVYKKDYLYGLFEKISRGEPLSFQDREEQRAYFMCMDDLAELLYRVFDRWDDVSEVFNVPDRFKITMKMLGNELLKLTENQNVSYDEKAMIQEVPNDDGVVKYRYGWQPKISILVELSGLYKEYRSQSEFRDTKKKGYLKKRWISGEDASWQEAAGQQPTALDSGLNKIYDIYRQLDSARPEEIFVKTIQILEETLDNKTISIYSLTKNKSYARLEMASQKIYAEIPKSIRMEDYREALQTVEEGEVWSNAQMTAGYPMYMTGIKKQNELMFMILIYEMDYTKMQLYYLNLIKLLCGMVQAALLRALDYQESQKKEQYIEGTDFLREGYFIDKLRLLYLMQEKMYGRYTLIRLDRKGMSLETADTLLAARTRQNDVLGIGADGNLYLVLLQTTSADSDIVVRRLEHAGFGCNKMLHNRI